MPTVTTARTALAKARILAATLQGYLASALYALVPVEAPGLGTMGVTKAGVLMFDPETVLEWSTAESAWVLVHEVGHLLRGHAERCEAGHFDHTRFNFAGDAEINDDLPPGKLPGKPILPSTFGCPTGRVAEEYYRSTPKTPPCPECGGAGGQGKAGQGGGCGHKAKPGHGGACGGCAGNPLPGEAEIDAKHGRSAADVASVKRAVAEAIVAASKGQGTVPGGWQRWAKGTLAPVEIPWEVELARGLRHGIATRPGGVFSSFTQPNRRQGAVGWGPGCPVMAGHLDPTPTVAFVLDTSGSMGDRETLVALRHVVAIMRTVRARVTFLAADADVHSLAEVRDWRELPSLVKGGGGTDFRPAFEALGKRARKVDVLLYFTDGFGTAPTEAPTWCRTIWILAGKNAVKPASWGDVVRVKVDPEESVPSG